jgi:peptidoglycan/LPS O-acetylase OafA/YrhL
MPKHSPPTPQQSPTGDGRIASLDFLRGIAAFAVMLFHFTVVTSIQLSEENPLYRVGVYGHLGVEIFFVISGLIIPYSMFQRSYTLNSMGKFLLRRTVRIEIPFLILIGIEILLIYISSLTPWKNGVSERLDPYNILLHAGYLNGIFHKPWLIPVFWTLAIEFQFYLVIALLFPLIAHSKFVIRTSIITSLVLFSFVFPQTYLFFAYGLFFLVGIVTFQLLTKIINYRDFLLLMSFILIPLYFQHGYLSLLGVVSTLVVILFFKGTWRWSGFLGMISYSLYLVHVPFGGRLLVLTQMYVQAEWLKSLLIVIYLGVTIFTAWLFYRWVEKPSLSLAKRIQIKTIDNPDPRKNCKA